MRTFIRNTFVFTGIALLSLGVVGVIFLTTNSLHQEYEALRRERAAQTTSTLAEGLRNEILGLSEKARNLVSIAEENTKSPEELLRFVESGLASSGPMKAMSLFQSIPPSKKWTPLFQASRLFTDTAKAKDSRGIDLGRVASGESLIQWETTLTTNPRLFLAIPYFQKSLTKFTRVLLIEIDPQFLETFLTERTDVTSTLIDSTNKVIASTASEQLPRGAPVDWHPLSKGTELDTRLQGHFKYETSEGKKRIGAFQKSGLGGITILVDVELGRSVIAETRLLRKTLPIAGVLLLCIALAVILIRPRATRRERPLSPVPSLRDSAIYAVDLLTAEAFAALERMEEELAATEVAPVIENSPEEGSNDLVRAVQSLSLPEIISDSTLAYSSELLAEASQLQAASYVHTVPFEAHQETPPPKSMVATEAQAFAPTAAPQTIFTKPNATPDVAPVPQVTSQISTNTFSPTQGSFTPAPPRPAVQVYFAPRSTLILPASLSEAAAQLSQRMSEEHSAVSGLSEEAIRFLTREDSVLLDSVLSTASIPLDLYLQSVPYELPEIPKSSEARRTKARPIPRKS